MHKGQSSETVGDDTKTGVTVLVMEDMRVKAYLIQNRGKDRELDTDARGNPRDHENTTVR